MAGSSNDCSPDTGPAIWLCHQMDAPDIAHPLWLTEYEHKTASKFSGPREREYLSSRWLIRQAIGKSALVAPKLCRPVAGRPNASLEPEGWRLSLSHSHGLSACATRASSPIGLDLEPCQRHAQWQKVVKRWFSPVEQEWLFEEGDSSTFLKVWTLKEAWLKATGRGIAGNLQTLEIRKGFEIYGDQPEQDWQAACGYLEGYLVTVVYRGVRPVWPEITLLEPPPQGFTLVDAEPIESVWEPLLQRTIRPKNP
ncbi:4'-phosphopantetheinyl transferase family protein [Marinobacter sp. F3R08]|uniref:4'-phosphopantetheinyl transferase family protein n=1 Tax=Marinobacter sp. F3R08 TaxID=2841559 RepID=UPI001C0930FB|nr:4'-phosphopantetheinyl transferase superfamily protein [Marinobacter sp. F3R08]MBU2952787.1 4'-phosphopantetheinyl transferase superfamily protein [Marinobacter sp. F3R08]